MRASTSLATAALVSLAAAGNAPAVNNNPAGITFQSVLEQSATNNITGNVKAAASPNGQGTNFQVVFYNLPLGNMTYGIYSGRVGSPPDCSLAGSILNPFNGVSGSACTSNNLQACEIGDLSDKYGSAYTQSGGAGTGYFSATYIDDYLSVDSSSESFMGDGSLVILTSTGTPLACADFVNANKQKTTSTKKSGAAMTSSMAPSGSSSGTPTGSASTMPASSAAAKSTSSPNGAMPTAAGLGSGLLAAGGLAAMLL